MPGLYKCITRNPVRVWKEVIELKRKQSNRTTSIDSLNKRAIGLVGVGILALPLIGCNMYAQQNKFGNYKATFVTTLRGNLTSDVHTKVGSEKTTIDYTSDLHGGSTYHNELEYYNNKEYQFIPNPKRNPKIIYDKKENITVILVGFNAVKEYKSCKKVDVKLQKQKSISHF